MHTYSTDNDLRPRVVGFIGIGSFLLVLGIGTVFAFVNARVPFGAALSAPATGAVFTAVYLLFASRFWNHWLLRRIRIVKTPYFAGTWEGYIQSSYDVGEGATDDNPEKEKTPVEVDIRQNWRKLIVELDAPNSSSRSLGASVITKQGKPQLTYYYLNEPDYNAPDTMTKHYGTTSVKFHENEGENREDVLTGIYYTGPDRDSYGKIHLTRNNKE